MSGNQVERPSAVMGRPGLSDDQLQELFGELSAFLPKSDGYRRKRRELAVRYERTEGLIDKVFRHKVRELAKAMEPAETGPRPSANAVATDQAHSTSEQVSA